jgi:hypothetical protein
MEKNNIYGGSPATNLTNKIKPQFTPISIDKKREIISKFDIPKTIKIIENDSDIIDENISYFNIVNRKYTKKNTDEEIYFMKELQNKLIKFIPY